MSAKASSPSQMEDILSRMEAMEKASKNMQDEIFNLQKDNVLLRSDYFKGQMENLDLKKELQSLRKEVKVLKRRVDDGKKMEMARKAGDKKLEDKITHLENVRRVLSRAMTEAHDKKLINEEVTELSNKLASVDTRISPLETIVASLEGQMHDLESKVEPLENKVAPLENKVTSLEGRTHDLENKVAPLQGKTAGLEQKLAPLEKQNSDVVKSQVNLSLNTRNERLVTGEYIKLSKCVKLWTNGGCLDTSSGRVKLSVSGHYLVYLCALQSDDGKIKFSLNYDNNGYLNFGHTGSDCPWLRSTIVVSVAKPADVWIEALRLEGEATIRLCSLYVRLLGYL